MLATAELAEDRGMRMLLEGKSAVEARTYVGVEEGSIQPFWYALIILSRLTDEFKESSGELEYGK